MAVLLGLYMWTAGLQGILLITLDPTPISVTMGVALLVMPVIGVWFIVRELLFGFRSNRLVDELEQSGELPSFHFPETGARRIGEDQFAPFATAAQNHGNSWQAWMRLGLAYDAAGDRRRARESMNRAIALSRTQR